MPFQDLIDFSGGINTAVSPIKIAPNEAVQVTSCEIYNGTITSTANPLDLGTPVVGKSAVYYDAQNMIVSSAEDRFYVEWAGFLYWSNTAGSVKRFNGTTTLDIGGWTKPTVIPTGAISATVAQMSGDYAYCYTYLYAGGFESPPSPVKYLTAITNKGVDITFTDTPSVGAIARVLYRLGGVVPTFRFIGEFALATLTTTDTTSDYNIDPYELTTFDNEAPPVGLDMLIENNGTFFGALNDKVYFSRQGTPEYWNQYNYIELPSTVMGIGKSGSTIIAFTDSEMYMINGSNLSDISLTKLPFQYGCNNKHTIANVDGMMIWCATIAGRLAVCSYNGQTVEIISDKHREWDKIGYIYDSAYNMFTTETYDTYSLVIKNAIVYNRKYFVCTNAGTYIFDFNNGLRISLLGKVFDSMLIRGNTLLSTKSTTLYEINGNYSGYINFQYKTGKITNGSSIANKSYRRVRVRGKGTYTITVVIDDVVILSSSLDSFYLPAEAVGTNIQFIIEGIDYVEIYALSYEYQVLAL